MKYFKTLVAACALTLNAHAAENTYPARPVRLVVPFAPGGGADFMGRLIANALGELPNYSVVVDNRGGAGGIIGTDLVAKAPPDGYTLGLANNTTHVMLAALNPGLPFNPLRDFTLISLFAYAPQLLVTSTTIAPRTVASLIALAKDKPGTLNFASSGNGSQTHLAGELFRLMTDTKITHVPYKGTGPGFIALMGGEAQMMFASMPAAMPFVQNGRIRALAITGAKRSSLLTTMPTLAESGVRGFEINPWFGVVGPAKLPAAIAHKLHDDVVTSMRSDSMKQRLASQGAEAAGSSPEEFAAILKQDLTQWKGIVEKTGLRSE